MKFTTLKQIQDHKFQGNHAGDNEAFMAIEAFALDTKNAPHDRAEALRIQSDDGMDCGRRENLSDHHLLREFMETFQEERPKARKAVNKSGLPIPDREAAYAYVKGMGNIKFRELKSEQYGPGFIKLMLRNIGDRQIATAEIAEMISNFTYTTGTTPVRSARKIPYIAIQRWYDTFTWDLGESRKITITLLDDIEIELSHQREN